MFFQEKMRADGYFPTPIIPRRGCGIGRSEASLHVVILPGRLSRRASAFLTCPGIPNFKVGGSIPPPATNKINNLTASVVEGGRSNPNTSLLPLHWQQFSRIQNYTASRSGASPDREGVDC